MSQFFRARLKDFAAYVPGEQPQDRRYIKLNTNESPYPPSPQVIQAVDQAVLSDLRLYPDPVCSVLKNKMASLLGVKAENVFLSNGSDDILQFAFLAFCDDGAAFPDITYGFYSVLSELHAIPSVQFPLNDDFTIDITPYLGVGKTVFLANPNAPTGIALEREQIVRIIESNTDHVVVVDEAYVDFGATSSVALTEKYENLLVCGTFSKSRSMAGARLGYAVGNPALIEDLEKIKYSTNPYAVNRMTLAAGKAAVDSDEYYRENCKKIVKTREETAARLKEWGFTLTDSKTNFIFVKKEGIDGLTFYRALREKGILVRHFDKPRICDFNRVTIGTPEEMEEFLKAAKEITEELL